MTRNNLISYFFAALLLFILYSTLLVLSPFTQPIFWAVVIAFGFYPLHQRIVAVFKKRHDLAAFFSTLLIFLIVAPILIALVGALVREVISAYQWGVDAVKSGEIENWANRIHLIPWVQQIENSEIFQTQWIHEGLKKLLINYTDFFGAFALKSATLATKNIFVLVINFFIMIFLIFFFLRDGIGIYRFIYQITPLTEKTKKLVFKQLEDTFSAVIRGQLVTALVQAIAAGIIYWLLGVPLPLFFAGVTFIASLIPVVGAAVVWVPLVIYLFFKQLYPNALILFLMGVFVISLLDNLLKPILIGKKTKLPYLLLFLGILGGLQVYGLMGIFLAPVVLSLFFVLIKIYQEEILDERN